MKLVSSPMLGILVLGVALASTDSSFCVAWSHLTLPSCLHDILSTVWINHDADTAVMHNVSPNTSPPEPLPVTLTHFDVLL